MSYKTQLTAEIKSILDQLTDQNKVWKATWITHEICENHKHELSGDAEFSRFNIYENVRGEVTKTINKFAGDKPAKEDNQLPLEGFDYVQSHYVITRDGEDVGLPVYQMEADEIDAKVSLYRKMGNTCHAHADELVRFKDQQFPNSEVA